MRTCTLLSVGDLVYQTAGDSPRTKHNPGPQGELKRYSSYLRSVVTSRALKFLKLTPSCTQYHLKIPVDIDTIDPLRLNLIFLVNGLRVTLMWESYRDPGPLTVSVKSFLGVACG